MNKLSAVWIHIEKLVDEGLSVIAVRDKDENGFVKKSPYKKWKDFQSRTATKEELFTYLDQYNTTAVATICGRVSGNLEVIDMDVKWYPGVDALLFKDIETIYPELFNKLRINKSPSGGYHLVYRVEQSFTVPGNQKLASRPASEAELLINPKEKLKCFFETRGEGGYVLAPPSLNYFTHKENSIPVLTQEERESLINLCKNYNQEVKKEKPIKAPWQQSDYYDVNPFDHFNNSPAGQEVLSDNGWTETKGGNSDYTYYTRPGGTKKNIHAAFYIPKRIFQFFTTNSEFEEKTWYNPSTALSILLFNGDKKKTYHHLVKQGYGQIKQQKEESIVRHMALKNKPLPANISEQAKQSHLQIVQAYDAKYPHGVFWQPGEKPDEYKIDREKLYQVANGLGFRLHNNKITQIIDFFIHDRTERQFFDALKDYIQEEDAAEYNNIANAYEAFLQRAGSFTVTRIALLDESKIIRDTKNTSYKFYQNGYVFITGEKYTLHPYANLAGLIWHKYIQPRQFVAAAPQGKYIDFIGRATNYDRQKEYIQKIIGFLAHQYKDETTGYIIVLTEETSDPRNGGGSGKNIFSTLFSHTTTFKSISGSQVQYNEKFLQAWGGERVLAISDVPKHFDFLFLKEPSTGSGVLKKLYQDEQVVNVEQMPKFIIQTNYSYDVKDGGLRRRIIPLEFTDFFTQAGGVDVHFKAHFPKDWSEQDWQGYDNFICQCVQNWIAGGNKIQHLTLSQTGWQKQFDQNFGQITREFIDEYIDNWCSVGYVVSKDFNEQYRAFCQLNNVNQKFELSSIAMVRALNEYCSNKSIIFKSNEGLTVNGLKVKCKVFGYPEAPF